jgi:uncharacterized protein YbbC (DUF1343 family)
LETIHVMGDGMAQQPHVIPGAVTLLENAAALLGGKRIGVLVHPASVLPDLTYVHDRLIEHPDVQVTALFAPEHGIGATAQDQVGVGNQVFRGLRVYSLYGEDEHSLRPRPEALEKIDTLVIDLQDVGARYYTYIYTMAHCLEACAQVGKEVIVCDRPNPLGGVVVDGPLLAPEFASFVGRFPMPVRHAKTIGELARDWNDSFGWGCKLTVLPVEGWDRAMWFDQTGLPWVAPSPNMPTLETAIVYPGGCLIEGTNLSEGRGTTLPFQQVGAPWLDGPQLAANLNAQNLPGVRFRSIEFVPTFHKFADLRCNGVFVHVTDREVFSAFSAYVELLKEVCRQNPARFAWRTEPYEFERDRLAFDLLCGTDETRREIEAASAAISKP